jgi:hypothetical protein
MRTITKLACAALAVAGFALSAQAHLLTPTFYVLPAGLGDPTGEQTFVDAQTGTSVIYLNKIDNNGSNPGAWDNTGAVIENAGGSSPFNVTFNFTGTNALTATISWNLTGTGFQLNDILIKDGSLPHHAGFLYALYPVSADETIIGSGTVQVDAAGDKNISHISFFGSAAAAPDSGTTAMLLGGALTCLGVMRRYLKR